MYIQRLCVAMRRNVGLFALGLLGASACTAPTDAAAPAGAFAPAPGQLRSALQWTVQQTLNAPYPGGGGNLGHAVAIDNSTAIIGAFNPTLNNPPEGNAFVYVWTGTTWAEQLELIPSDAGSSDCFGCAVAVSGDTAVIGAPSKTVGGQMDAGEAYVFVRSGTTWAQQQILVPSDVSHWTFGVSVAISGDTAVVGAGSGNSGEAYVFVRSGKTWTQQQKLTASDGAPGDEYGMSVAVSGDTVVIGAPGKTVGGYDGQGQAYVYVRSGTSWSEQQKLGSPDGASTRALGGAVALSGDTALIGAPGYFPGQAYVYTRAGTTWSEQQRLAPWAAAPSGGFGTAVAVSGDTALVGGDGPGGGGEAYLFGRTLTSWDQRQEFVSLAQQSDEEFGHSVALSGETALIGAPMETVGINREAGQVYVAALAPYKNGVPCSQASDCASGYCVDGVCCDRACGFGDPTDCQSCVAAESGGTDGTCAPIAAAKQTICRFPVGSCDVAERCDGESTRCPADQLAAAGMSCQSGGDPAQPTSRCTGTSSSCPPGQLNFAVPGCASVGPWGPPGWLAPRPGTLGEAWALATVALLLRRRRKVRRL